MRPIDTIHKSWKPILHKLYEEPLRTLTEVVLPNTSFQPAPENIFRVFKAPLESIKVVLLGQDPYPTKGVAVGLSFVNGANKTPLSLRNIYKEVSQNSERYPKDITTWEQQGVFLLNTALTVETGTPGSHLKYWSDFTKAVIQFISYNHPTIWLLWGQHAQSYRGNISRPIRMSSYGMDIIEDMPKVDKRNYIFEAPHPASEVYSGGKSGFFGCNHFNMVNEILRAKGIEEINW